MLPVHSHWRQFLQALLRVVALVCCSGLTPAYAQAPDPTQDGDPPGRVARLSEVAGSVWLSTPDSGDWLAAIRNQPLTTGDRLATDAGARAELQVGSTTLRLGAASEIEVLALDDRRVALRLVAGSLAARVRTGEAARELSLDTSEGRFRVEQPGRYRFDHAADGTSAATVAAGQAVYEGDRTALVVTPGQRAEFWIDAAGVAQYRLADPLRDEFHAWADERDNREAGGATARYVSPEMTGAADLDRFGAWDEDPDHGAVWVPRGVAPSWAPYSQGRWTYVRPWGWTWIDDAPWGFAPFHYGRWVYARDRWCWAPGQRVARPVYAPALVAWVGGRGFDARFNVRGGPAVGWFPLAPHDVFVPGYRYSPRYVREVNQGHVRDVGEIDRFVNLPPERRDFRNRRFPHALTAVPAGVVSGRQPVGPAALSLDASPMARDLASARQPGFAFTAPPIAAPTGPVRSADARLRPPGFNRGDPGRFDAGRAESGRVPRPGWNGQRERGDDRPYGGRPYGAERSGVEPAPGGTAAIPPGLPPSFERRPGMRSFDDRRTLPAAVDPRSVSSPMTAPSMTAPSTTALPANVPRPLSELRPDDRRLESAPGTIFRPSAVPPSSDERRPLPGTVDDLRMRPRGEFRPPADRDDRRFAPPGLNGDGQAPRGMVDERRPSGRMQAPAPPLPAPAALPAPAPMAAPAPAAVRPAAAPPRPDAPPPARGVEPPRAQPAPPGAPAETPLGRLRPDDRRQRER